MGNLLVVSELNQLLFEVQSQLEILTNCNTHKGMSRDIVLVQKRLISNSNHGFYIPFPSLKSLFKNTPIKDHSLLISSYFSHQKLQKVNILEVMASLITYSSETLEEKVKLALDVFDFDGNRVITKDEMVIMCISFIKGIAVMTQSATDNQTVIESLAQEAFYLADSNPDGMITYEE